MNLIDSLDDDILSNAWIKRHLDYTDKNWCLIWPFSRSQTGYAMFGGDATRVHRLMCEHKNGPPPTPSHYAAHSCDRGHEGCVNQHHLSWKTPSENQLDRFRSGEPFPKRKLTPAEALEVRNLKGLERILDTATRFGISESNVRLIQAGKTWRLERQDNHIFTREEVLRIRATPQANGVTKAIAKEFDVHVVTIQRIRSGHSYRHFLDGAERS